jgi:integrase
MPTITKTFVERAKLPALGETFYRDDALRGFALRCNWGGTKSFILESRIKGRPRRLTIGRYPDMSVLKARAQALKIKSIIAHGGDPTIERERGRNEPTFADLADRYINEHAKQHKASWARDVSRIEAHFARWKTRKLSDISAGDVVKVQNEIATRHGKVASNRALTLLRSIFNKAIDWNTFTGSNPVRVEFFTEKARRRFLKPEELQRVNQALVDEPNQYWRAYFPLAMLLGTRKNELLSARWNRIDLTAKTFELPSTKSGQPLLLPVPGAAMQILESLPSRGTSEWVFPGEGKTGHLVEPKKAWDRIRERASVQDVTIHDLRRTLGSWLAAQGFSLPMIGAALNHSSPTSTAIYARMQLDPVRAMLEQNAAAMFGPAK